MPRLGRCHAKQGRTLVSCGHVPLAWPLPLTRHRPDLPADEVAAAITVAVGLACTWLLGAALARAIGVLGTETHR